MGGDNAVLLGVNCDNNDDFAGEDSGPGGGKRKVRDGQGGTEVAGVEDGLDTVVDADGAGIGDEAASCRLKQWERRRASPKFPLCTKISYTFPHLFI